MFNSFVYMHLKRILTINFTTDYNEQYLQSIFSAEVDVFKRLKNTFMSMECCNVITSRGTVYKLHDAFMASC